MRLEEALHPYLEAKKLIFQDAYKYSHKEEFLYNLREVLRRINWQMQEIQQYYINKQLNQNPL